MDFGKILHSLRKDRDWTLQELSSKSGIGIATLSRLENGEHKGTLKTHIKLCDAFDIRLAELYKDVESNETEPDAIVPVQDNAETFTYDDKAHSVILIPNALTKNMLPALIRLEPGGRTHLEQNQKGAEKFIYCLEGRIEITIENRAYNLGPNGVLYFRSSLSHRIANIGKTKAKCLCISSPAAL